MTSGMRTAKSWVDVVQPVSHLGASGELERQIERVQLDAFKAGAEWAAEKAHEQSLAHFDSMEGSDWKEFVTEEFFMTVMSRFNKATRATAKQLKELPK